MVKQTTADVAHALGISPGRVRRLAKKRGVGRKENDQWVFTDREVDKLRDRRTGWPKGRPRKKKSREDLVLDALARSGEGMTTRELTIATHLRKSDVIKVTAKLVEQGKVLHSDDPGGPWFLVEPEKERVAS